MRRFRSKLANTRKNLYDQHALEESRRKLAEIKRSKMEAACVCEDECDLVNHFNVSDIDSQVEMEQNQAATGKYSSSDSSDMNVLTLLVSIH
jgi:hypothetical protein